jgi:hypothetical protein
MGFRFDLLFFLFPDLRFWRGRTVRGAGLLKRAEQLQGFEIGAGQAGFVTGKL